jgi:hypothetical protein
MEIIRKNNIVYSVILTVIIIGGGISFLVVFNISEFSFVEWKNRSPSSQGVNGELLSDMTELIDNQSLPIHGRMRNCLIHLLQEEKQQQYHLQKEEY